VNPPTPDAETPRVSRFTRLRAATDRVPTTWFAAIGTGLFLAATAAFGSLNTVAAAPPAPLATLGPDTTHTSAQSAIAVRSAVLVDELSATRVFPEDGERLLVVLVEIENLWTAPLQLGSNAGVAQAIRLADDEREAGGIVREDDQTDNPRLQPGVPALLAFTWAVPATRYADGDELTVLLRDPTLITGQLLYTGASWGDYAPAAEVHLPIRDAGAGTSTENGDGS